MWGMIYRKGDHAVVHDHWPALWSGVYYLKSPKNSGDLYFPQLKQSFEPKDNMLVLFNVLLDNVKACLIVKGLYLLM